MFSVGGLSRCSWETPLLKCAAIPNLELANKRYEMAEQKMKDWSWTTFPLPKGAIDGLRWDGQEEEKILNWIWNFVKLIKEMKVLWGLKKQKIILKKKKNKQTKLTANHLVQGRKTPTWIVSLQEKTWKVKIVLKLNPMNHFLLVFTVRVQGA